MLTRQLVSFGLTQSKSNPMLFTYTKDNKVIGAVVVHVDDLLLGGKKDSLSSIGEKLQQHFKMSKVGLIDTYLSLKVEPGAKLEVYLSQQHYIQQIVDTHLPADSRSALVP